MHERRDRWHETESLLSRVRGGSTNRFAAGDLERLGRLYRQLTSDLAIARRDYPAEPMRQYLEQLAGRVHPVIYHREARQWSSIVHFVTHRFPRAFREATPYTFLAFSLTFIPFALSIVLTIVNPTVGRVILPPGGLVDKIEQGQSWMQIARGDRGLASSFIMTNNIRVAFVAFAGGILFGLGTVAALVENGLVLGATAGLAIRYGLGGALISFVSPHGGIEMTVIFVSGGAGLRMGQALLFPGLQTRRRALSIAASKSVVLLFGCVPLLVIAGTLEGFVSPSGIPYVAKFVIGAIALLCLYGYLLGAGRTASQPTRPDSETTEPTPLAQSRERALVSR